MSLLGVPNFGVELAKHLDRELRRRTAVSEWKPISTAPDDGTRILLVNPLGWVGSGEFKDGFQGPGFYFEGNTLKSHPTHWQYLPPPPEVK